MHLSDMRSGIARYQQAMIGTLWYETHKEESTETSYINP